MDIKDKILNRLAKQNMIKWQLDAFVKTHPALYKTIREAMEEYAGLSVSAYQDKLLAEPCEENNERKQRN